MAEWLRRIRERAATKDGSLLFRSAVQAKAAIERSRARWGQRGLPYPLRSDPPAPDDEWVWLGEAIVESATGRDDLDASPSLLPFRIRDESPMEAYMRLDRFRVAWDLPPDHDVRYLEPSGEPYLTRPAERLLEHAYREWETELAALWHATPEPEPRGLLRRFFARLSRGGRRADRRKRADLHEAVNTARLARFVRLVRVAYAPEAELRHRLARLDAADRRVVLEALEGLRAEGLPAEGGRSAGPGGGEAAPSTRSAS